MNKKLLFALIAACCVCFIACMLSISTLQGCVSNMANTNSTNDETMTEQEILEAINEELNKNPSNTNEQQTSSDLNYPLQASELDNEPAVHVNIDNDQEFNDFVQRANNGELDNAVVSIDGYSSCFNHRFYISSVYGDIDPESTRKPDNYVGIPYEINGAGEPDYPKNGDKIHIVGKIMSNPANTKVKVLITLPKHVQSL